jgi:serine O-acetyltransferase
MHNLTKLWYFFNRLARKNRFLRTCSIFEIFFRIVTGATVPIKLKVGEGLVLAYGASGLVVHEQAILGKRVLLSPGVIIGGRGKKELPIIGDDVKIMPGAKVLGGITIGSGSLIGVNAVVLVDLSPGSVALAPKAKISSKPYEE